MSTGMHNYGSGRRTWAKWRERNRTGNCLTWQLIPGYYSASPEVYEAYGPMLDSLNKGRTVRTDEPVAIWETVTHTWADFKAAIERATHG